MKHIKDELAEIKGKIEHLETSADKLKNKHLRDLVVSGLGRIKMALDHPDIDLVDDDKARAEAEKSEAERQAEAASATARGANPVFQANDPGAILQAQEAARRDRVDAIPPAPVDVPHGETRPGSDPDAMHPGDPAFFRNQSFQDPHNVDLNKDGTLKTAPNTLGVTDDRDKK